MILSVRLRRQLRRIRRELVLLRHRFLWKPGQAPAIRFISPPSTEDPLPMPAIRVELPPGEVGQKMLQHLGEQTESSWSVDAPAAPWLYCPEGEGEGLAPETLESLLLVGAACDLSCVRAGGLHQEHPSAGTLLRIPGGQPLPGLGRRLDIEILPEKEALLQTFPQGWFHALPECREITVQLHDVEKRLARLPVFPGPRTAIFVLPFLAIGGAERLLYDLLKSWKGRYRVLIVCLDQHQRELGRSIGNFSALGLPVFRLGDWLPREARIPALRHLIRRRQAEVLFSWNGSIDFYDHIEAIHRDFPSLRIYDQHYNHSGAWLEWLRPEITRVFTAHIAVNERIRQALKDRGAGRVEVIHHAVEVPKLPPEAEQRRLRSLRRRELGVPENTLLVGSFIRLHSQKRPLDILRLAGRMEGRGFTFLLVGGGPEEKRVREELRREALTNFIHLPLQEDTAPLFDALDIALLMSEFEGLPVFLLEAMAREIPCVAPDVGEIRRLFSRGGGVVVESPGDLASFETALEAFRSALSRREEGVRGRAHVEEAHGLEAYSTAYERVLFP